MDKQQYFLIFFIFLIIITFSIPMYSMYHLRLDYEDLQKENQRLRNTTIKLEDEKTYLRSLKLPDGMDQHYEKIRNTHVYKHSLKGDRGWNLFHAMTILHDLGAFSWNNSYRDFISTHNSTCNNLTSTFIRQISDMICDKETNEEKLIQIYEWVDSNIHYVYDEWGYPRFPIETMVRQYGDCEDQAGALSLLLEYNGFQTALGLIHDKNLTEYDEIEGLYHTFCLVKLDDFSYNGSTIELFDNDGLKSEWIILDPSYNQVFGEDPIWLTHYNNNLKVNIPDEL